MATRLVQIAVKAHDDSALGRFWAEALGWSISSEGPGVTNLQPEGFTYPAPPPSAWTFSPSRTARR
ncbi:hypothetical protein SAMN06265355_113253 [Actinomadura mexicana]|uniref:Glyoxalase-like domain-containing protein n=1 Tax=Actinomadura mexicana TaxID=134959 RepID=A0A239D3C6_9ACTN|nr:hypothetical protein SAMN06265355_113253 [Actinomadura mexicana]